jgi:hypothetical protein
LTSSGDILAIEESPPYPHKKEEVSGEKNQELLIFEIYRSVGFWKTCREKSSNSFISKFSIFILH